MTVTSSRWGVDATREVQRVKEIGLSIRQGVSFKYFHVTDSGFKSGITLNWIVRPSFDLPLSQLPTHSYQGYPVILQWPKESGLCPEELAPFNGRYLGTITECADAKTFRVSIRDGTIHDIDADALFLEARTDVLSEMENTVAQRGQPSIQRRILQLSHSLKSDGRRNVGILRDQLQSALRVLDPAGRGQVSVPLFPNCDGKLWINCCATGARKA